MKVATAAEMRKLDTSASEDYGIPPAVLMENAGLACRTAALEMLDGREGPRVVIVCGRGNNGGDGLVAARHLHNDGVDVTVFVLASVSELRGESAANAAIVLRSGIPLLEVTSEEDLTLLEQAVAGSDLVLDALFGTGLKGEISGLPLQTVRLINASRAPVLSVDIPSGLDADSGLPLPEAVQACRTVTLALPKPGLLVYPGAGHVGEMSLGSIGAPACLLSADWLKCSFLTPEEAAGMLPGRSPEAYKNSVGMVLVLGGAQGMTGAVAMSGMAALKAGAGMVRLVVPSSQQPVVAAYHPELMVSPADCSSDGCLSATALAGLRGMLQETDALIIGPGMTRHEEALQLVRLLLQECAGPLVLDADALYALSSDKLPQGETAVLTPHAGEAARLLDTDPATVQKDRFASARAITERYGAIVVLKGARTLVAHPDGRMCINLSGNPGMATAGAGDVLSGVIASLMGQGMSPWNAAVLGVYLHGLAGDLAAAAVGIRSLVAGDIIESLSCAYQSLEEGSL